MSTTALKSETYVPREESRGLAEIYDFLKAHENAGRGLPPSRYFLAGAEAGEQVEIPAAIYPVLLQVIDAMRQGLAVTVSPQSMKMTTQQAADLLGISRPTLIKFLDEGRIPFEKIGAHRRVLLQDVLDFRELRRAAQYAALEATAVPLEDEDDIRGTLADLKEARRVVSARRRSARGL